MVQLSPQEEGEVITSEKEREEGIGWSRVGGRLGDVVTVWKEKFYRKVV